MWSLDLSHESLFRITARQLHHIASTATMHFSCNAKQKIYQQINVNPCPAELFELKFSSFEAGIANAISSFK